jgi:formylglycine-generating enzyme required for sulfatase activity
MKSLLYIASMVPAVDLHEAIKDARRLTDELFTFVRPESLYERPIPERHRLIFYLGHLEAFDWNLIGQWALSAPVFQPEFDKLFAFGIDPDESGLPHDTARDWPRVPEIAGYNAHVRQILDPLLREVPAQLLHVALEHRLMHAETLAYLLHNLDYRHKQRGPMPFTGNGRSVAHEMVRIPAGTATLGRAEDNGFGWDNEFREYTVHAPSFLIGKYKVTNGEFLDFVQAGGPVPHFWTQRDGQWMYRGMFGEVPLPLDAPVYAMHEEASAYACWAGGALPTEEQWHRAAEGAAAAGNLSFRAWDPVAVNASPEGDSARGVAQLIGNGWEWTATVFGPFPGFEPFPFYKGYSADFFDGRHYVMKGASPRTDRRLARSSFRNWFRARYPYAYAGFRLVVNS